jgi:cellulose biosynthesis protein BcsQ
MIISLVQTKGGTGKSILALSLAYARGLRKHFSSISLIEFDPQGTLHSWWLQRQALQPQGESVAFHHIPDTDRETLRERLDAVTSAETLTIIDTPGESTGKMHTKLACVISDLVLIPMRASTSDEAALAFHLLPIIRELQNHDPDRRGRFQVLPTFVNPRSRPQTIIEYFRDILPQELGCLSAVFPSRAVYENFNREGVQLYEYARRNQGNQRAAQAAQRAIADVDRITDAILSHLSLDRKSP